MSIWLPCAGQTGSSALILHHLESTGRATPVLSCIGTWGIKRTKSSCDVSRHREKGWSSTGLGVPGTQAEKLETSPWPRQGNAACRQLLCQKPGPRVFSTHLPNESNPRGVLPYLCIALESPAPSLSSSEAQFAGVHMGQALLAVQVQACSMTSQDMQRAQARPLLVMAPSQHHHPTSIVVRGQRLTEIPEAVS